MTEFRLARPDELDRALAIWPLANSRTTRSDHLSHLREWARQSGSVVAIALDDTSEVAAMAMALPGRDEDGAGALIPGLVHLTGVCVRPEMQSQGLAAGLVGFLLDERYVAGFRRATLWTHAENAGALRLFDRHGFEMSGRGSTDGAGRAMVHLLAVLKVPS